VSRGGAPTSSGAAPPRSATVSERALIVLAVDPIGLGGAVVRGREPEVRAWAEAFCALLDSLQEPTPIGRLPLSATPDGVSGGLDVAGSLAARAPRVAAGLLPRTDGGVVLAPCAERLSAAVVAELCSALDEGAVRLARDGLDMRLPARVAVLALDSGAESDEAVASGLAERLALRVEPGSAPPTLATDLADQVVRARARLGRVTLDPAALHAICATAEAVGEPSLRAARFCARVAAILAALGRRRRPSPEDLAQAAALVLAPRARRLPELEPAPETDAASEPPAAPRDAAPPETGERDETTPDPTPDVMNLQEMTVAAVRAALPPGVFGEVAAGGRPSEGGRRAVRRGRSPEGRGAPAGVRRAERSVRRIALAETLKAAAPWQSIRRPPPPFDATAPDAHVIRIAASDLRRHVRRPRPKTAVTLVVDASGSAAIQRLAEAKGAVEHLLDRCYARRDEVALLTFRGAGTQVVLPSTRSLTRVRRSLGELAAGGATPLADALDVGARTAMAARDRGAQALLVLLTDGRANVTRAGVQGRAGAHADALDAARAVRARKLDGVFIDISPRGEAQAREIAEAMGARYLRLPHVEARALAQAVRAAAPRPAGAAR
jgi:magnesium chelatase subunit D